MPGCKSVKALNSTVKALIPTVKALIPTVKSLIPTVKAFTGRVLSEWGTEWVQNFRVTTMVYESFLILNDAKMYDITYKWVCEQCDSVSINGDATEYKGLYMKNYWLERFMVGLIVLSNANSIRMNLKTFKNNIYIASMQKKTDCLKKTVLFVFFNKKHCFFCKKNIIKKKRFFAHH